VCSLLAVLPCTKTWSKGCKVRPQCGVKAIQVTNVETDIYASYFVIINIVYIMFLDRVMRHDVETSTMRFT
jgi:hypothetical protein